MEAQDENDKSLGEAHSNTEESTVNEELVRPNNLSLGGMGKKRRMYFKPMDLALSAQKKIKKGESGVMRRGKECICKMNTKEMCLRGERVILGEENLDEVPNDYKDFLEDREAREEQENAGEFSQGGGGWPSTAARHP